jgi:tetratricopeptide (TPR) repeat protein
MTTGLLKPLLLLGRAARNWAVERRRVVLLHELAHVKRGDWPALLLAELAAAVYWFHPVAWWISRRVRRDAETACDDLVIAAGTKPSVYAGHLLGIFRALSTPAHPVAPALAMVRPHQFEERLRAILDPRSPREHETRVRARLAAAGLLVAAAAVAAVEPWKPVQVETTKVACMAKHTHASVAAAPKTKKPCNGSKTALVPAPVAKPAPAATTAETALPVLDEADEAFAPVVATEDTAAVESEAPEASDESAAPEEAPQSLPAVMKFQFKESKQTKVETSFVKASNGKHKDRDWYDLAMGYHHDEEYDKAIEAFQKGDRRRPARGGRDLQHRVRLRAEGRQGPGVRVAAEGSRRGLRRGCLHAEGRRPRQPAFGSALGAAQECREKRQGRARGEGRDHALRASGLEEPDERRTLLRHGTRASPRRAVRPRREGLPGRDRAQLSRRDVAVQPGLRPFAQRRQARRARHAGEIPRGGFDQPDLFRTDDDLDNVRNEPRFKELQKEAKELSLPPYNTGWNWWDGHHRGKAERAKWREAAERFEDYAQRNPNSGRAWYNLGFASLAGDRPEAAVEAFQKALALNYRKSTTMYNLACTYSRMDQKDPAFDWLFKALDAGFDNSGPHPERRGPRQPQSEPPLSQGASGRARERPGERRLGRLSPSAPRKGTSADASMPAAPAQTAPSSPVARPATSRSAAAVAIPLTAAGRPRRQHQSRPRGGREPQTQVEQGFRRQRDAGRGRQRQQAQRALWRQRQSQRGEGAGDPRDTSPPARRFPHPRHSAAPFSLRMFHTFSGVIGMSMCRTPRWDSASTTALAMAGGAPTVADSPTPFAPKG